MFAAKYQLKQVTVAVLNCTSFHSLCCLMNRNRFATVLVYCPADDRDTLFEVSPDILCGRELLLCSDFLSDT